jgi:hypothetical protein
MKPRGLHKAIIISASIALAGSLQAQPSPPPAVPASAATPTPSPQVSTESKNALVVRIDPAKVLDSSGQSVGKVENIVLSPSGCADAVVITGERGKLIPVPWQVVKVGGETRGVGQAPGSGLTFTVNANSEQIIQAPSFARDQWPNVTSVSWLEPSVSYFKGSVAAGGTSSSSSSATGAAVSPSVNYIPVPPVAVTNNANLGPQTSPIPPSTRAPVNPGPPISVPPTQPPGTLPPPVTPPPSTSVPPNTPPAPAPAVPTPSAPTSSPSAGF